MRVANREEYQYFQIGSDSDSDEIEDERFLETLLLHPHSDKVSSRLGSKRGLILGTSIFGIVVVVVIVVVVLSAVFLSSNDRGKASDPTGIYLRGAVAAGGTRCSQIGYDVIRANGTAVDAAIAALFCEGLVSPQSMGIGGGFFMVVYSKAAGKVETLNARERAPNDGTQNMFQGNSRLATTGGLAVAVPGEIKGYYAAKLRYGNPKISWESLIRPSIQMARNGITVTRHLRDNLIEEFEAIRNDPGLRSLFINPKTQELLKEGDVYKRPKFASTLEKIAQNPESFYSGNLARTIVKEIQNADGIILEEDLNEYEIEWNDPIKFKLQSLNYTLYGHPPPSSGIILTFILNILDNYRRLTNTPLTYHRIIEAFKWAYGMRSRLGDPYDLRITETVKQLMDLGLDKDHGTEIYKKIDDSMTVNNASYYGGDFAITEDHGTSHISVIAPNGDAVSVTSTINTLFGAKFVGAETGIIYNNEMDDFSSPNISNYFGLPPSPNNFIRPGKRPMSSMSPTIILDENGDVALAVGTSGGTRITSATAYTIIRNLWFGENIKDAIESRRIHHQLMPMQVTYEKGFDEKTLEFLKSRGHSLLEIDEVQSVVVGVARDYKNKTFNAYYDERRGGGTDGE